jgi:hypothetical protein
MENVKEFAEYATPRNHTHAVWAPQLTRVQHARRVPQGGHSLHKPLHQYAYQHASTALAPLTPPAEPDKREFIRISQAVGIGFLIMGTSPATPSHPATQPSTDNPTGVIGYIVKLVHIPVNNILVGGS